MATVNKGHGAEIRAIAKDMAGGADRRAAHLVNLSLATFKWLILNGESDDVKFRAADALLALSPCRAKLDQMRGILESPGNGNVGPRAMEKRIRAVMTSPEKTQLLLSMVEQAERDASAAQNSPNKAA